MKQTIKKLGIIAAAMIIALAFIACKGPAGPEGPPGVDGVDGVDGVGVDGAQGEKGDKGDQGEAGEKGDRGDLGLTGSDGESVSVRVFTVSFDSDGGSAVPQQKNIFEGNWARQPVNAPTKPIPNLNFASETTAGLYLNHYQFDGWYLENEFYNFDTPITSDLTLTARWSNPPIDLAGQTESDILYRSVSYMRTYPGEYTLLLDADISSSGSVYLNDNNKLTLMGISQRRTITLNSTTNRLFAFSGNASLILDDNITIKGSAIRNDSVLMEVPELIMRPGSIIEGHQMGNKYASVYVHKSFIMEGGTIMGNTGVSGGVLATGIAIIDRGARVIISGGMIKGNVTSNNGIIVKDMILLASDIDMTLSGDAEIGELAVNTGCHINIASPNVKIGQLSLGINDTATLPTVIAAWIGTPFIHAAEGYTLSDFDFVTSMGNFYSTVQPRVRSPLTTYKLVLENGVGVLRAQ